LNRQNIIKATTFSRRKGEQEQEYKGNKKTTGTTSQAAKTETKTTPTKEQKQTNKNNP
jgi:hypothetical protein